jgi:hypothetical protein
LDGKPISDSEEEEQGLMKTYQRQMNITADDVMLREYRQKAY